MHTQVGQDERYRMVVYGVQYLKVIDNVFEAKDGQKFPWRQLVGMDQQGNPVKFSLHKDYAELFDDSELSPMDEIQIILSIDMYGKQKAILIEPN